MSAANLESYRKDCVKFGRTRVQGLSDPQEADKQATGHAQVLVDSWNRG